MNGWYILGLILVIGGLVFKVGGWWSDSRSLKGELKGLGEWKGGVDADRKNLEGFSEWKGAVDTDRENFKKLMDEIRDDIKNINKRLEKIFHLLPKPIEATTSPRSLTDYGKELSEKIGASEISDTILSEVTEQVKDFNAYQIQEHCFVFSKDELLENLKNDNPDIYKKIHDVAFEEGLEIEKLTRVIALELRDKILSDLNKHPSEIDQHNPEQ